MAKTHMPQKLQEPARPLKESEPLFSLLNAISEDEYVSSLLSPNRSYVSTTVAGAHNPQAHGAATDRSASLPKTIANTTTKPEATLTPSSVIAKKKLSTGTVFGGVYLSPKPSKYCRFCGAVKTPQWRRGPDKQHSLVCPLGTSGLVLTPNSLCNACGLRFLTMVQKEAKVLPSSTAQRVTVCSLVNPPKQAPVPLAPSRSTPTSETYFQVLPSKESSMGPRKAAPMVSATKTTTMRFSWNPPAVRPPKGFTTPSLSNPYMRSAW